MNKILKSMRGNFRKNPNGIQIIQPSVAPKAFGATLGQRSNKFIYPERVGLNHLPPIQLFQSC